MTTRFENNFTQALRQVEKLAAAVVLSTATEIRQEIVDLSRDRKSGRIYEREAGRTHRASALGEAFAEDAGALNASLEIVQPDEFTAVLGTPQEHGPLLEDPDKLNRPSFVPAAERTARRFGRKLKQL